MLHLWLKWAGFVFAILISAFDSSGAPRLRGATARIDITPSIPVMLGGYASRTNLSQGVHDPLSARAMALEDNGRRLLLISLDNLGFYNHTAEPLRQAILDACHLDPDQLFLCAIHDHSAPILTLDSEKGHSNNVAYTRELQSTLVRLSREALGRLAPVRLEFGLGSSPVGANRREVVRDTNGVARIVLGRNPKALTDREVQVLKLTRTTDSVLLGVLFAYATHSTSLGPRNYLVSGDVHGLAAQFVEKYLGADPNATNVVAPEFAGASGNIDPWYRVLPAFNTNNGWIPEPILLGTMLGEEAVMAASGRMQTITNTAVRSAIKTVQLPGKPRDQADPATAETTPAMTITVACVGDTALVGLGGEVFTEIGRAIKESSPFSRTLLFTHCNGAAGYLPTSASYPEGGYEVQSSPFAPGADERLILEVSTMLKELHTDGPR